MSSCPICGASLAGRRSDARYCSGACRVEGLACSKALLSARETSRLFRRDRLAFLESPGIGRVGREELQRPLRSLENGVPS